MEPPLIKPLLLVLIPAVVVGAPLLVGSIAFWIWLRRSNRMQASRPFLGAAISGAVSLLSMFAAVALLIAIAMREERQPDYFENHPLLPLLMIGFGLLALATAFIAALFAVWMVWRLIAARAAPAPTQSAG